MSRSTRRWPTPCSLPAAATRYARALPALGALPEAPAGTRLVWAGSASGDYPVFFGEGLIVSGFAYPRDGRRFVVTDTNVARHQPVEGHERIVVEPGEERKTLAAAEEVLRALARGGAERGDLVVAVGGGVVGDLAGFCAAVYQRGMRHVQVPTTLVAQVDSAYGGKTGVDLPEGKNYAGSYHQPSAVLCDPAALATLPAGGAGRRVRGGREDRADRRRRALGAGPPGRGRRPRDVIWLRPDKARGGGRGRARRRTKAGAEPWPHGGHAIEAATGYARYRHGEAVGIGLLAALRLSGRDALRAEVAELLAARGLPARFGGSRGGRGGRARGARQEAHRRPGAVRARGGARRGHARDTTWSPDDLRAAVEEVHAG